MTPQMMKNGYPRLFVVNVTIAGSLQPLVMPPSHNAVIYSLAAGGHFGRASVCRRHRSRRDRLSLMVLCFDIAPRQLSQGGGHCPRLQASRSSSTPSGAC
jgi:hypothetical protein